MNNYLYIIGKEECIISVNGEFLGAASSEPLELVTEQDSILFFTVFPLNDALPYSFKISINNGNISYPHEYIEVLRLPANRYEIQILRRSLRLYVPPVILDQQKLKTTTKPQKKFTVSLVKDAYTHITIDDGKKPFTHILPDNLSGLKVKCEILNNNLITAVTAFAPTADKEHNLQYLLIIAQTKDTYHTKIDVFADKIEQSGDKISILKALNDIAARGKMYIYNASDFSLREEYFVYTLGTPRKADRRDLIPLAVFQSVKCQDYAEACSYLTDELNHVLPADKLKDFFAEYESASPNTYYKNIVDSFLLIKSDGTVQLFRASFVGAKIDNFTQVEL